MTWLNELFDQQIVPFGRWVKELVDWLIVNATWFFDILAWPIRHILDFSTNLLVDWLPWYVIVALTLVIGWKAKGWKIGVGAALGLVAVGLMGLWDATMATTAMIVTAVVICVIVGIPLGIWSARSDRAEEIIRPLLDAMQTVHPFIWLIPIVFFFGIGNVPGTLATIIFALPPMVRLTNLGIRQVSEEVVEAGKAFGSTERQLLWDIQLPLAMPTIMAGLNQTLMLSLSMVVIAALIAGGGLGQVILRSVGRADIGLGAESGLAVLILAVILDRLSQQPRRRSA